MKKHKRFPLRHVPLFWLGLLPVVVLLWAWADSTRNACGWSYSDAPDRGFSVGLFQSAIRLGWVRFEVIQEPSPHFGLVDYSPTGPGGEWIRMTHLPRAALVGSWFPPLESKHEYLPFSTTVIKHSDQQVIPLWLILLCYLPLWLGATWWQVRRKARRLPEMEQGVVPL